MILINILTVIDLGAVSFPPVAKVFSGAKLSGKELLFVKLLEVMELMLAPPTSALR